MIQINKGKEPKKWTEKKTTPGFSTFEAIPELREELLIEQGYICAYCMRRIPVKDFKSDATSKIEHIKSQEEQPDLQLDYANMAICCPGNLNNETHCDTRKRNRSVTFNLHEPYLQQSISYTTNDGTIKSSRADWNNEIENFLNLNHTFLKLNRKNTLEGVLKAIESAGYTQAFIRRKYKEWSSPNIEMIIPEYCGIVVWFLNKKLK